MFNGPHWFCPRDHVWFYAFWSALLGWLSWMTTSMLWEGLMEAVVSTPQRWYYSCLFYFHLIGLGVVLLILMCVKRFWICQSEEPMNGEALQAWAQDAAVLASVFFRFFSGFRKEERYDVSVFFVGTYLCCGRLWWKQQAMSLQCWGVFTFSCMCIL